MNNSHDKIKITVLIAIYNAEKYLKECLDSLVSQTLKDIQIICINDGSKDRSQAITEEYAKKDKRIKLLSQKNSGASAARNLGLKHALGNYICMVDSDDYLGHNCLEKSYKRAIKDDLDATVFKLISFGSRDKFNNKFSKEIFDGRQAVKLSLDWSISGIALFKAGIIQKLKYNNDNIYGVEFSTREFFLACKKVGFTSGKYYFRQHPDSATKRFSVKLFESLENNIMLRNLLIKNNLYDETKGQFEINTLGSFISLFIQFTNNKKKLTKKEICSISNGLKKSFKLFDFKYLKKVSINEVWYKKAILKVVINLSDYNKVKNFLTFLAKPSRFAMNLKSS